MSRSPSRAAVQASSRTRRSRGGGAQAACACPGGTRCPAARPRSQRDSSWHCDLSNDRFYGLILRSPVRGDESAQPRSWPAHARRLIPLRLDLRSAHPRSSGLGARAFGGAGFDCVSQATPEGQGLLRCGSGVTWLTPGRHAHGVDRAGEQVACLRRRSRIVRSFRLTKRLSLSYGRARAFRAGRIACRRPLCGHCRSPYLAAVSGTAGRSVEDDADHPIGVVIDEFAFDHTGSLCWAAPQLEKQTAVGGWDEVLMNVS